MAASSNKFKRAIKISHNISQSIFWCTTLSSTNEDFSDITHTVTIDQYFHHRKLTFILEEHSFVAAGAFYSFFFLEIVHIYFSRIVL